MKALVLDNYNVLNYRDFPDPEIQSNEVLIEVKACGICGSDVHGMDGSTGRRIPPVIMGHEASGVIIETGSKEEKWNIGDRVTFDSTIYPLDDWYTLNGRYNLSDNRMVMGVSPGEYRRHGAFAEKVAVPQHILYRIPSNVTFVEAAMVEPIAVAAHAINVAGMKPGSNVIVAGAGMVGVFVIKLLNLFGANKIFAIDIDQDKLELAGEFGADFIINPAKNDISEVIKKNTKHRGADLSFEVVGIEETVNQCINNTRKGGTIVLVGNLSPNITFPLQKVVTQEMSILGSCAIRGEYEMVLELISDKKVDPAGIISAIAPLSEGASWFNRLYNKEKGLNKVILTP